MSEKILCRICFGDWILGKGGPKMLTGKQLQEVSYAFDTKDALMRHLREVHGKHAEETGSLRRGSYD